MSGRLSLTYASRATTSHTRDDDLARARAKSSGVAWETNLEQAFTKGLARRQSLTCSLRQVSRP